MNNPPTPISSRAVKLHTLSASQIPTSPASVAVEFQGTQFQVSRPNPSDQNAWRGSYVVREMDTTDYYATSLAEVREWVRLVVEAIAELAAKKSA